MSYSAAKDEVDLEQFLNEQESHPPGHQLTLQPIADRAHFVVTEQYQVPPVPPNVISPLPAAAGHSITVSQPIQSMQLESRDSSLSDYYLGFSIFLTVFCFFCGAFLVLLCTIPAMIYACKSKDEELRGDAVAAETSRCISMIFNVGGMIVGGVIITVISYVLLSIY